MRLTTLSLLVAFACAACGSIDFTSPRQLDSVDGRSLVTGEGEVATVLIDAHVEGVWVFFDLETGTEVDESDAWDLAFQRFQIRTSDAAARVATPFEELTSAPAEGYQFDAEDSDDDGEDPDYAFLFPEPWYEYQLATHRLDAIDVTYVVRTFEGHHFKVQMLDYYDAAGSSGHPSFRYASIDSPTDSQD